MTGNIPSKLKLFVCDPIKITVNYDDCDIQIGNTFMASETYVSDADNKKTCETGQKWAEQKSNRYNYDTKSYYKTNFSVEEVDNVPIKNVVITSLEHRGQGGRAYKVIVNDRYYVDLREDVLLDAILHVGINSGGKLMGEYLFAKVGSQMKLIRINSALYNELIKSTAMDNTTKIKNLKIGRIYESKTEKLIYIGKVDTTKVNIVEDKQQRGYYNSSYHNTLVDGKLTTNPVSGMLFYKIRSYDKNPNNIEISPYRFSIRKSHSLRVDTGIDVEMPDNWLDTLKNNIYKYAVDTANKYPSVKNSKFSEIYYMTQYSELANIGTMHPAFQRALTS